MMKEQLCTTVGMVGGFIAALLGGWDSEVISVWRRNQDAQEQTP